MPNIRIRPLEKNDAYTSVRWRNIPELWIYTKFKTVREISIDDELTWIEKVINDPQSARFAIIADDTYVGNIYITNINKGVGEYHIFIGDKDYWGKGIAREASIQIINYGKDVLGLKTLTLEVRSENAAAHHLYETLGFKETGKCDDDFMIMKLDVDGWSGDPRKGRGNETKS